MSANFFLNFSNELGGKEEKMRGLQSILSLFRNELIQEAQMLDDMIKITLKSHFCHKFCLIWFFTSHQQSFSYKGTDLPGSNQY